MVQKTIWTFNGRRLVSFILFNYIMEEEKKTEYRKWEYDVRNTEDMLWCQTLLDEMWEEWWELIWTQMTDTTRFGWRRVILWIFKRPVIN